MEPLPETLQPRAKRWPLSLQRPTEITELARVLSLADGGPKWTLDLQWKSPIWYGVSLFLKCWLTLQLPPFPFHDNLPFWNISNVRDQTGFLLELDLLQEGSTVVMFCRTNMDPRGQTASSAPGSWSRDLLTTLPTCVCIGVWYQTEKAVQMH